MTYVCSLNSFTVHSLAFLQLHTAFQLGLRLGNCSISLIAERLRGWFCFRREVPPTKEVAKSTKCHDNPTAIDSPVATRGDKSEDRVFTRKARYSGAAVVPARCIHYLAERVVGTLAHSSEPSDLQSMKENHHQADYGSYRQHGDGCCDVTLPVI